MKHATQHIQQTIYEKITNGGALTDYELDAGYFFFSSLGNDLGKLGPVFSLQANECRRIAEQLYTYSQARKTFREEASQGRRRSDEKA